MSVDSNCHLSKFLSETPDLPLPINHPASGGTEFIGYDWNWGLTFEFAGATEDTPSEPCEDDPDTTDDESESDCLISAPIDSTANDGSYYIRSFAYWHEDFPFMDLSILQDGNGIGDSQ